MYVHIHCIFFPLNHLSWTNFLISNWEIQLTTLYTFFFKAPSDVFSSFCRNLIKDSMHILADGWLSLKSFYKIDISGVLQTRAIFPLKICTAQPLWFLSVACCPLAELQISGQLHQDLQWFYLNLKLFHLSHAMHVLNGIFICIYWCSHLCITTISFQAWEPQ